MFLKSIICHLRYRYRGNRFKLGSVILCGEQSLTDERSETSQRLIFLEFIFLYSLQHIALFYHPFILYLYGLFLLPVCDTDLTACAFSSGLVQGNVGVGQIGVACYLSLDNIFEF